MKSPTYMLRLFGFVLTAALCTELHAMMEARSEERRVGKECVP